MTGAALATVGIFGGSGLYDFSSLSGAREVRVQTPYGDPSDSFVVGDLDGVSIAFLPRHGRGHRLAPSEINFRANLWAMKSLGVSRILSASAVGSLQEKYAPTHIVLPDQFIDRTRHRPDTFFGDGVVAHVAFGDPICGELLAVLAGSAGRIGATVHRGGTYVAMEGPQFSTRAESFLYRSWGADVIGMTNLQEAKLAREAEICYATIALVTDYDCWHESEAAVSVEQVLAVLRQNSVTAGKLLVEAIRSLPRERACGCGDALRFAVITSPEAIAPEAKRRLAPILSKYFPA